ncbi:hypothetical protein [Chromobacterium vaccinii]|uniref:hypothetical protein n=1 Tax=Chromobacterium vaccinii TaxID=1108595 RepID=UPI001E5EDFFD|nr:hypothetical protein [Chromobacterium vaccinii]MCD4502143.1 hypothetical protein [Chromobacterium vaccinii]
MLKKIDSNPKAFAIIYGAVGSIAASAIWLLAPLLGSWLATSSWDVLVRYINHRYEAAATLEPVNYSFFVLTVIFVVVAILWFETAGRLKKMLYHANEPKPTSIEEAREPSKFAKAISYGLIQFVVPLYLLYALVQISGQVITLNAITDFKQHMRILAPYITAGDSAQLYSKWSQMRTTDDYDAIYKHLSEVAKAHSLHLPRNHTY